jgi:hypothetical protein
MSREASDMSNEKTHDHASIRRELAKTLRKFLPPEDVATPTPAPAPAAAPAEVTHDAASVRKHVLGLLKKTVEDHASQMAALRARELRKTGTEHVEPGDPTEFAITLPNVGACLLCSVVHTGACANFAKAAEVVDMKGKRKTIGAVTPKPAEPTKPVGMDEGSGGVIVPGKKLAKADKAKYEMCPDCEASFKVASGGSFPEHSARRDENGKGKRCDMSGKPVATKKAEPPMAKPPSGSVPGKTTPQSQPGGAPAAGAPKSSAAPMAKEDLAMCEHDTKKAECSACSGMMPNGQSKPREMAKGDFGTDETGRVATTPAQAAGSGGIKAAAVVPKVPQAAAGVRGTPQFKIRMPGRDGTAGLVSPKLGVAPAAPAAPAGGVKLPRPTAPMAPLGRVTGK